MSRADGIGCDAGAEDAPIQPDEAAAMGLFIGAGATRAGDARAGRGEASRSAGSSRADVAGCESRCESLMGICFTSQPERTAQAEVRRNHPASGHEFSALFPGGRKPKGIGCVWLLVVVLAFYL